MSCSYFSVKVKKNFKNILNQIVLKEIFSSVTLSVFHILNDTYNLCADIQGVLWKEYFGNSNKMVSIMALLTHR